MYETISIAALMVFLAIAGVGAGQDTSFKTCRANAVATLFGGC